MEFYHISMDLKIGETEFIPRIPQLRCKGEDKTTKRICVCTSIMDAISAFPYKGYFVNVLLRIKKDNYLVIYKTESDNYLSYKDISDRVPDAYLTKESWLLNPFKSKAEIIKIKKLTLMGYNKYINEYSGQVKELEYETDITDYDRVEDFILISKKNYNQFCKVANENNINIEVLENKHIRLQHLYYNVPTTKRYRWIKIKAYIPAGISVAPLWLLNDKQNNFAIKKKILLNEGQDFDEDYWGQFMESCGM